MFSVGTFSLILYCSGRGIVVDCVGFYNKGTNFGNNNNDDDNNIYYPTNITNSKV